MKTQLSNISNIIKVIDSEIESTLSISKENIQSLATIRDDIKKNIFNILCPNCKENEILSTQIDETIHSLFELLELQITQNQSVHKVLSLEKEKTKELVEENDKLYLDALTSVGNRHKYEMVASEKITKFKQDNIPFSLAILDIDFFKKVNDEHGHDVGDKILKVLGTFFSKEFKEQSEVFRYGGEEFVVISEYSIEELYKKVEKLRAYLETRVIRINDSKSIKISFSGGVSEIEKEDEVIQTILIRADRMLYKAKSQGRNKILRH